MSGACTQALILEYFHGKPPVITVFLSVLLYQCYRSLKDLNFTDSGYCLCSTWSGKEIGDQWDEEEISKFG